MTIFESPAPIESAPPAPVAAPLMMPSAAGFSVPSSYAPPQPSAPAPGAPVFPTPAAFPLSYLPAQLAPLARGSASKAPLLSVPAAVRPSTRRLKSSTEIAEQVERTKKRRRESAQRSRTRRNCYVKALEAENGSLKDELQRLRELLVQAGVDGGMPSSGSVGTPQSEALARLHCISSSAHSAAEDDSDAELDDEL
ncbi:hypothetical protein H632_c38p0 [Helicosporidium sp. ATCC 50920]|nr:hypothetical protein H632_c38p0 [Helicosporidium sp. ATCC 50920]|eukprot:KDD77019.1 hypothetical protein H632_c38p0 [Helicosporidium sp. ATCC 50920]